jgi:hypothetical protein
VQIDPIHIKKYREEPFYRQVLAAPVLFFGNQGGG